MPSAVLKQKGSEASASEMVERLKGLPSIPLIAMEVNQLVNKPHTSLQELSALIQKDPTLTAQILKLANSSYYGIPGGVTTLQKAITYLGFHTLAQLVFGLSVFSLFHGKYQFFPLNSFWKHSFSVGLISELIAKKLNLKNPEEFFTCGLLHDIGKVVLLTLDENHVKETVHQAQLNQSSFYQEECRLHSSSYAHTVVGELLARQWGLPLVFQKVILEHHYLESEPNHQNSLPGVHSKIIALANQCAHAYSCGFSGTFQTDFKIAQGAQNLGLNLQELNQVLESQIPHIQNLGEIFSVSCH